MTNKDYFKNLKQGGIPFMEGRDKGDIKDILNTPVHIEDFGFINGDNGQYVVFIVKENDKEFYCGGQAVTEILRQIKSDNMKDELPGAECKLEEVKSKNNRKYITITF